MHLFLKSLLFVSVLLMIAPAIETKLTEKRQGASQAILCLTSQRVPYVDKTSPKWSQAQKPYNLRLSYQPAAITLPTLPKHVQDSVLCAALSGLKVQAKSGGHSYASYSSGGQDGSVVIDMKTFNTVNVDQGEGICCLWPLITANNKSATWIAKVGTGVRVGNIALELYDQGKRALPQGTCSGIGIGGSATHGGYGYTSRKWGLTLDHIVAMDVILANGTEVHATETRFPDLFYALRGAADSIGVVTYFYFRTLPAPNSVLVFSASLVPSLRDANTAATAFQKLQTFVLTSVLLTPNITFGMYTDSEGYFGISGWCIDCDEQYFTNTVSYPFSTNLFSGLT